MIFTGTGEVANGLYVLGSRDFPVYLLGAEKPVLFDAGIVKLGRIYEDEIKAVLGKSDPRLLLLTHMHFDHCGSVSHLKSVFPGLKVCASRKASEIIRRPNAVKLIQALSENAADALSGIDGTRLLNKPFEPFDVEMVLEDGDIIESEDGLTVQAFSTPGHTWDFLSYYIPERRILIASEAAGCMAYSGIISTACLTDFGVYLSSLDRLASLEVEVLCLGHISVCLGEDAKTFLDRSIETALHFKILVKELWEDENGEINRVMERVKDVEYDPIPLPKQPEPAYLANLEARVRSIAVYLGLEKAHT